MRTEALEYFRRGWPLPACGDTRLGLMVADGPLPLLPAAYAAGGLHVETKERPP